MSEWQPIDSAPKDGTRILLMRRKTPKFERLPDILWVKLGKWCKHYLDGYEEGWREDAVATSQDNLAAFKLSPSHWLALDAIGDHLRPQPAEGKGEE